MTEVGIELTTLRSAISHLTDCTTKTWNHNDNRLITDNNSNVHWQILRNYICCMYDVCMYIHMYILEKTINWKKNVEHHSVPIFCMSYVPTYICTCKY